MIPTKSLLERILGFPVDSLLMEDNYACITVLESGYSPKLISMPRTHRISVAALSEAISNNLIKLQYVESRNQLADILTKALNRVLFLELRTRLGILPPPTKETKDLT